MTTTYRNLITGEPAQQQKHKKDYFELEIVKTVIGSRYATSEGEFLCAYGAHQTFKEAWLDALTYTTIGGDAYQAYQNKKADEAEALTQQWAEDSEGFDPYAGNLDTLLGY